MQNSLICLSHTKHSDFVRNELRSGRTIDLLASNAFLLKAFLGQSHDIKLARTVSDRWNEFVAFLKSHQLKIVDFKIGVFGDHYFITYTVLSKTHPTPGFRIDRGIRGDIPYNFIPAIFATWMEGLLNDLPHSDLIAISNGA